MEKYGTVVFDENQDVEGWLADPIDFHTSLVKPGEPCVV